MTVEDAYNLIHGGHIVSDADLRQTLQQVYDEGYDDGYNLVGRER